MMKTKVNIMVMTEIQYQVDNQMLLKIRVAMKKSSATAMKTWLF